MMAYEHISVLAWSILLHDWTCIPINTCITSRLAVVLVVSSSSSSPDRNLNDFPAFSLVPTDQIISMSSHLPKTRLQTKMPCEIASPVKRVSCTEKKITSSFIYCLSLPLLIATKHGNWGNSFFFQKKKSPCCICILSHFRRKKKCNSKARLFTPPPKKLW